LSRRKDRKTNGSVSFRPPILLNNPQTFFNGVLADFFNLFGGGSAVYFGMLVGLENGYFPKASSYIADFGPIWQIINHQ
jgi:hypothetical protein